MKTKLTIILSTTILFRCSSLNITDEINIYKQNENIDLPTDIKINNFWTLKKYDGLDSYILDNRKKISAFNELYKRIQYQKGNKYVLPLYSLIFNTGTKADTLYINDAGQGYSTLKKKFFVDKKIYIFLKELDPEFFNQ